MSSVDGGKLRDGADVMSSGRVFRHAVLHMNSAAAETFQCFISRIVRLLK